MINLQTELRDFAQGREATIRSIERSASLLSAASANFVAIIRPDDLAMLRAFLDYASVTDAFRGRTREPADEQLSPDGYGVEDGEKL